MNIDKIKLKVKELSNEKLNIKVYIGRNKYEYYEGIIDKIYNKIITNNIIPQNTLFLLLKMIKYFSRD